MQAILLCSSISAASPLYWQYRYPTSLRQLAVKEVGALESLLPAGQKKVPKVYRIAAHPLQPHLLAVGANTGTPYLGVRHGDHLPCPYATLNAVTFSRPG